MIKSLNLVNFRKHEKLSLDFTPGLNGIFGPNYAGKSTVIYGILFALGGVRAIPCSTVLRNGASTYKVDMVFAAGDVYRVVRTKSTDRLYKGDQESEENLIANGATVVNKKIEEIIGMTAKRFLQTRFAQQKKTHAILLTGANELYAVINEISGADTVEAGILKLADRVKRLDGFLDNSTVPDVERMRAERDETAAALAEKTKELTMWQDMLTKTLHDKEVASAVVTALRAAEKQFIAYDGDMRRARQDMEAASRTYEKAQAAVSDNPRDGLATQEVELQGQLSSVTESINSANSLDMLIAAQRRDIKDVQVKLDTATAALAALSEPIDPGITADSLVAQRAQLAALHHSLDDALKSRQALQATELEPNCSKCGRPWDDHAEKKAKLDAEAARLDSIIADLEPQVETLRNAICSDQETFSAFTASLKVYETSSLTQQQLVAGFQTRLQELTLTLASNETKLAAMCPDGLDVLRSEKSRLTEALTQVQRSLRRADQDAQDLERAHQNLTKCTEVLQALLDTPAPTYTSGDMEKAVAEERACYDSYTQASTAVATSKAQEVSLHERLQKFDRDLPVAIEIAGKIADAEKSRSVHKSLTKFLKVNRDRYMADVWTVLMAQASQFVQQCTSGAIEAVSRSEDGDFTYTEDGKTLPISEASGAQLSIMGLAMQLALSSAVQPPLDVLLVDEPNADMDPEHSMAVNLLLAATVGQVICVSHSHMDSAVCENVIEL